MKINRHRKSRYLSEFFQAKPAHKPFWLGQALSSIPNAALKPIARALVGCRTRHRCKLNICPTCGKSPSKRVGVTMLKHILGHGEAVPNSVLVNFFTGEERVFNQLDMRDVSFVTINGPRCDSTDPDVIAEFQESFSNKIKNVRRRYLKNTAITLNLEFSLGDRPVLHAHMLVYHRGYSREWLANILRDHFDEPRAISVSQWWKAERFTNKKIAEKLTTGEYGLDDLNLAKSTKYTAKALPNIPVSVIKGKKIASQQTLEHLGRWILQTLALRCDGYKGSMYKFGVKKIKGSRWSRSRLVLADGKHKRFSALDIARQPRKNKAGKSISYVIRTRSESFEDYFDDLEQTVFEDIVDELRDSIGIDCGFNEYGDDCDEDVDIDWQMAHMAVADVLSDTNIAEPTMTSRAMAAPSIEPSPRVHPVPECGQPVPMVPAHRTSDGRLDGHTQGSQPRHR